MDESIINIIIQQEKILLDKTDSISILADLIDEEFIEIGSSAAIYNKQEIMNWFKSGEQFERTGSSFKTHQLSEEIILLTYISSIKDTPISETKYAIRSSIWRLRENKWRMIFHQGTPMK